MKKILTLMLVIATVATMSVTALAALSPVSVGEYLVTTGSYATGELGPADTKFNDDGTVTVTRAKSSEYIYEGWKITGKYEIVSGSLTGDVLTVRPVGDLRIIEMYENAAAEEEGDIVIPDTGVNSIAVTAIALLTLSVAFSAALVSGITKKHLA